VSDLEAALYQRRRLLAALLGRPEPPPGVLRPLACGALLGAALAGLQAVWPLP
jgi:hypothetical protein